MGEAMKKQKLLSLLLAILAGLMAGTACKVVNDDGRFFLCMIACITMYASGLVATLGQRQE